MISVFGSMIGHLSPCHIWRWRLGWLIRDLDVKLRKVNVQVFVEKRVMNIYLEQI